jgi:hypothetical protein
MKKIKFLAFLSLFVCLAGAFSRPAGADIFYSASNYATGSAGVVRKSGGGEYTVRQNLVANLGVDAAGFTFDDPNGAPRAMVREYRYGPNDSVYIWDPSDWKYPIVNTKDFGSNIHAAAGGRYLYLATYESYAGSASTEEDGGEVVRVDMRDGGYRRDRSYHYGRFTSESGNRLTPRGEAIHVQDGKVYVLFGMPYNGVTEYEASEIVEFDLDLNPLRRVRLENFAGAEGRNAARMAFYGGKLYAACMGGFQGPDSRGDIWEVDISAAPDMTARQALDGRSLPYTVNGESVNVGMYAVDFAPDGTAFVLAGSYDAGYTFRARLFVTTAARLSAGDIADELKAEYANSPGKSWGLLWDEPSGTLWCMAGTKLEARDKNGALLHAFTARELGDNIYSVSLLNGVPDPGDGGGGKDSGGGGGCNAGLRAVVFLFLVSLFALWKRMKSSRALWALFIALVLFVPSALPPEASYAADALYDVKFRVTQGAGIRAFHKTLHFYPFTEYPLTKAGTKDGHDIYTGKLPSMFHYEAGGPEVGGENSGFLKQARVISLKNVPEAQAFDFDVELEKLDLARRVDNGFRGDGVYFNVNDARRLELRAGETFKLLPIRVWQAMEGITENYFIEPDYTIEILGDKDALEYEWKGSPGSRYAELRGLAEGGVAVLRVTYAPLKLIHQNGKGSTYFNATNPVDTGIVVVSVVPGGAQEGPETNIAAREYDTFYFDESKTDHSEYSFKPDRQPVSVRVHRPIHQGKGGAEWGKGWSDGRQNTGGGFTVDLYEGRNIVEVAFGDVKKYHVIDARGVIISVKDGTGAARLPGDVLSPGEELEITFDGIKTPLEKIAAIYNPGSSETCYVSYRTADAGAPGGSEARSAGVQYDLSEKNAVKVVVPASGVVRLTDGTIYCGHIGDLLGSHRDPEKVLGNGLTPNFSAVGAPPSRYGALPDIFLGVENANSEKGAGGGGCSAGGFGLTGFFLLSAALFKRSLLKDL